MTDAAVLADSAPAPEGAPINENPASYSEPLGSQIPPEPKQTEPAKPASLDESIDRAIAKSEAKQTEAAPGDPKPEPKAESAKDAKPETPRDPTGKCASTKPAEAPQQPQDAPKPAEATKPSFTASDAPARFSEDAKREWATAPEPVRRETERAIKELTEGFQKYKASAERDESLREFHDMAAQHGTDVKTALTRYTQMENLLRQDPIKGLSALCENMGTSLRDVAAHVLGQTPDQNASQQDATIRELRQELAAIKQQVGGVTQTIEQQRQQATLTEINSFASSHPRFEELSSDIAFFIQSGRAKDLPEAYELAERLNPAPASLAPATAPAASTAAPDPKPVHPDKGQKSINGAPSPGLTSPSGKKRAALSLDDALDRAFGAAG